MWRWIVLFAASVAGRMFFRVLNRLEIKGNPNNWQRPGNQPTIFYANHRNYADPFAILFGCLLHPFKFFSGGNPAIWSVAYAGHLNGWRKFLIKPARIIGHESWKPGIGEELTAVVQQGGNILIFPEGRRHVGRNYGDLAPFQKGLTWLVKNFNVRVVPVALTGTDRLLPLGSYIPRVGRRIQVVFGDPVPSATWNGKSTAEITADLEERLKTLLRATT